MSGLSGDYVAIRVDRGGLSEMVSALKAGDWQGLNVTMPLKGEAAALADELSADAAASGSVNTLSAADGLVVGDSTDCTTFRYLVGDGRLSSAGTPVLVLGAGGSAAAALVAMATDRPTYVSSRRQERAAALAARFGGDAVEWGTAVAGALVVNTTPLGMQGESLPEGVLEAASALIDLPYASASTPAVTDASRLGLRHVDGHEFLLRQAIASFRLWTGVDVDYEPVRGALRKL